MLKHLLLVLLTWSIASGAPTGIHFNAPTAPLINNCFGVAVSPQQALIGSSLNQGVLLSGSASLTPYFPQINTGLISDCIVLDWYGTGSGTFTSSTLPVHWNFNITTNPSNQITVLGWTLLFNINQGRAPYWAPPNGNGATLFSCSSNCTGDLSSAIQSINTVGQQLSTYQVQLIVGIVWNSLPSNSTTLTVTVPPGNSIDINTPVASPVPAVSTAMLMVAGLGLLVLGALLPGWRQGWFPTP